MRARVVKIGNSQGVRIPKPLLEQTGILDDVEIEVKGSQLIIRPVEDVRHGWESAFKTMTKRGDDDLLIPDNLEHDWDDAEWQWK